MTSTEHHPDRSVLRRQRAAAATGRDGRGLISAMPPILQYGFRPFFLAAALQAGVMIPAWLVLFHTVPVSWHAHEMIFGYLGAVIAGFILTAVPNWTGRLPLSGWPLAVLIGLWLAGRIACDSAEPSPIVMAIDLAFPVALTAAVWREVIAGRNWKNAPVAGMLTLFTTANALHHLENVGFGLDGIGIRLGLGTVAMLIALIGGRIVPSFTRNWLARQGSPSLPARFGLPDKAALATTAMAMVLWTFLPDWSATGILLALSGTLLGGRMLRWRGFRTLGEPIVAILHAGYLWLAVAIALLGLGILVPGVFPATAALHALTTGAIGTMTLAVMTRASLGHTGRAIEADGWTVAIYILVTLGALFRVAAPLLPFQYLPLLMTGGVLWSGAFLVFAGRYGPILCKRRASA
ncbi:NnrS family protein [Oricola nitratireducens]|uniref:NnrS family protein n=1 Tax=Oricola nitratireducens TaxID=2775868 RepID=UPI001866B910|nr:NnrS family protein [Oricola nitratireducens]